MKDKIDPVECEICGEEIPETEVEEHFISAHPSMRNYLRNEYGIDPDQINSQSESEMSAEELAKNIVKNSDDSESVNEVKVDPDDSMTTQSSNDSSESEPEPDDESQTESKSPENKRSNSSEQTDSSSDEPYADDVEANSKTDNPASPDVVVESGTPEEHKKKRQPDPQNIEDSTTNTIEESQNDKEVNGFLDKSRGREKWFIIGIGGCGGNIVDALLLRANSLRQDDDHPLSRAWERAIRGIGAVNADADSELASTYWAQEYKNQDVMKIADNYKIGPPEYQGSGNIEERGSEFARWTLDQDEETFAGSQWGKALRPYRIDQAQGVMLFHSAVQGTGTGASPVIADRLKEEVLTSGTEYDLDTIGVGGSSLYSSVILPSQGVVSDTEKRNGLIGLARLVNSADAVIPFDNENLEKVQAAYPDLRVPIPNLDKYQFSEHQSANEVLISFLETLSLTSAAPGDDGEILDTGEQVDVQDVYHPAKELFPKDDQAVVLAPAYGHININSEFNKETLDELVARTLVGGKLVDFDHQTAWGGAFLVAQSGEYGNSIKEVGQQNLRKILSKEEYLNFDLNGDRFVPTSDYYIKIPGIDGVRLCAVLYNPRMERLENWRDWADGKRGGNTPFAERIDEKWEEIEELFRYFGREQKQGGGGEN